MSAQAGYGGNVTITGGGSDLEVNVHAWSLDYTADTLDSTDFSTSGPRTFITGLKGWSGTFESHLDGTAAPHPSDVGAAATISLQAATSRTWGGDCFITGVHPSVTVDGINAMTVDFQGTSDLSIA